MSSKPTTDRSLGHAQARGARRLEHAGRLHVGGREHRRRRVAAREQLLGEPLGDGRGRAGRGATSSGRTGMPASREHLVGSPRSRRRARGEAERVVGVVADERDALVAELDQVPGGDAPALDVVGDDHRHALTPGVDEDDRHAGARRAARARRRAAAATGRAARRPGRGRSARRSARRGGRGDSTLNSTRS